LPAAQSAEKDVGHGVREGAASSGPRMGRHAEPTKNDQAGESGVDGAEFALLRPIANEVADLCPEIAEPLPEHATALSAPLGTSVLDCVKAGAICSIRFKMAAINRRSFRSTEIGSRSMLWSSVLTSLRVHSNEAMNSVSFVGK